MLDSRSTVAVETDLNARVRCVTLSDRLVVRTAEVTPETLVDLDELDVVVANVEEGCDRLPAE